MVAFLKSHGTMIVIMVILVGISVVWYFYRENHGKQLSLEAHQLNLVMTEFLKTLQEDSNLLNSKDGTAVTTGDLSECDSTVKAMECWLNRNEDRLLALTNERGGILDEKTRAELTDTAKKLRDYLTAMTVYLKPKIAQTVDMPPSVQPQICEVEPKEPILTKWLNRSVKFRTVKDPDVPDEVLTTFAERYTNPEIRLSPYYFKNIKIIRAAKASKPGVYCISFQAEVFHRENSTRWAKSPVVLNVVAAETPEAVLSTYENFTEKPWEFPKDGACVHSRWGVNDYEWCEICPYPCMSSYSPIFSRSSKP
jgi:hypothetical protein